MSLTRHSVTTLFLLTIAILASSLARAQPTPGKEEIVVDLPSEYRWKRTRVRKDTKSIRESVYHVAGKNAQQSSVKSIRINTIDRRYFPMSSASAPADKLNFQHTVCPDATLTMLDQRFVDTRSSVLFSIQSDSDGICGETILLSLAAEGPTAYHTIELEIDKKTDVETELATWSKILLEAVIQ